MVTRLINLSPDPVVIKSLTGNLQTFDPSGFIPEYCIKHYDRGCNVPYLEGYKTHLIKEIVISNMPIYVANIAYIVTLPMLVFFMRSKRMDIVCADYQMNPIKDADGRIIAATYFMSVHEGALVRYPREEFERYDDPTANRAVRIHSGGYPDDSYGRGMI